MILAAIDVQCSVPLLHLNLQNGNILTLLFFLFNRNMSTERGLLSFIFDRPLAQFIYESLDKGSVLPLYLLIFKIMNGIPTRPKVTNKYL